MERIYRKLRSLFLNVKIRQRMIAIYFIGGVIPLIAANLFSYNTTRQLLLSANEKAESEELGMVALSISESLTVLTNVIRTITYDRNVEKIALKDYSNNSTKFYEDCNDVEVIQNLQNYYKQNVAQIRIYLVNDTIKAEKYENTDNFRYLDETVKQEMWYKKTAQNSQTENWFYGVREDSRKSIQVSRGIYDDDLNMIGVVLITMQDEHLRNLIDGLDVDTMVLCGKYIVYSNYMDSTKYDFAYDEFKSDTSDTVSKKITNGINEYQMFSKRIDSPNKENVYSIIGLQNYNVIMSDVYRMFAFSMIPVVVGLLVSLLLISVSTNALDQRINLLLQQMQKVARGDYESVVPVNGDDEIGLIYNELTHMINDIQSLMSKVVDEQVQKEKIHTRQKEVEFKMLASQINPHFLYNTLETIRMKAVVNHQPEIVELVKMLAKILRYNIQVGDSFVKLKSEIDMNKYYLKIQNYRFGDRIHSEVIVEDDVDLDALVMPLIIQPFVENAFSHGLEAKESDGHLKVYIHNDGDDIIIEVSDDGVGMTYYELGELKSWMNNFQSESVHIGVANVNQRIKMMYGDAYGVNVESEKDKGTNIILRIPHVTGDNEDDKKHGTTEFRL
ncbi:MAG: sensor histidine kinase [Lachnospiraceae bacterium]|nr:sensor histidine kinase [Lachnospiraceae bacterium]